METLLAHSGTGGEPAAWTVRIKDNVCTFDGPNTVPHANLTVKLVIDEQNVDDTRDRQVRQELAEVNQSNHSVVCDIRPPGTGSGK